MSGHDAIVFTVFLDDTEHVISTFKHEYRSLMALIRDQLYPDSFGECGGMGRCSTCQVQLQGIEQPVSLDRNEQATLKKSGVSDGSVRLSCQILIDASLQGAKITVVA
jgi:ferredoxin, 2Fe-2S